MAERITPDRAHQGKRPETEGGYTMGQGFTARMRADRIAAAARTLETGADYLRKTPPNLPEAAWYAANALRELRRLAEGDDLVTVQFYCEDAARRP